MLKELDKSLERVRAHLGLSCRLTPVPSLGAQAVLVGAMEKALNHPVVFVCQDDRELRTLQEGLHHLFLGLKADILPAWNCRPFDCLAPDQAIQGQRACVIEKFHQKKIASLTLTTVNALMQKVPRSFHHPGWKISAGESLEVSEFQAQAHLLGYQRSEIVEVVGDYCLRGGLIDIFPASSPQPLRIDLLGDQIESIRFFDPNSQLSTKDCQACHIHPIREWSMTAQARQSFLSNLRLQMGRDALSSNPFALAVQAGAYTAGLEHCLPWFYEEPLVPLTSLIEKSCQLVFGVGVYEFLEERLQQIEESYHFHKKVGGDSAFAKPEELYLSAGQIQSLRPWQLYATESPHFAKSLVEDLEIALPFVRAPDLSLARQKAEGLSALRSLAQNEERLVVLCHSQETRRRLQDLLDHHDEDTEETQHVPPIALVSHLNQIREGHINLLVGPNLSSFGLETQRGDWVVLHESDLFGVQRKQRRSLPKNREHLLIRQLQDLSPGDLLVDEEYGIGRFEGLETMYFEKVRHEFIKLEYADEDRLRIPIESLNRLSRYSYRMDQMDQVVRLDRLSHEAWQRRKAKAREDLLAMAHGLLEVAASREVNQAPVLEDTGDLASFAAGSGFVETDDQKRAIEEILVQMRTKKPSDRLVCGDAGYGKTEIALQASFVAAQSGYQVLLLAPTTLLVRQHVRVFRQRFRRWPFRIAELSRFITPKKASAIRQDTAQGAVQIIIGTHALLSRSLSFKNIGLVIIDEEQNFGVKQKERLKSLAMRAHILNLSATPIPRTLQMALGGLQDLSIIATPPVDRLGTRNFLCDEESPAIKEAIRQELQRDGQVFYVCPRINDLDGVTARLRSWFPNLSMSTVHGKMSVKEIETSIDQFVQGKISLLISTPIVESGLDIPRANTIIVHRADRFGIAQLYQLRGRVGRSNKRGWCYYTTKGLAADTPARRRLDILTRFQDQGMGLSIAAHDLDARGSGNLLGEKQSGHIREIGVELYQKMLIEVIEELKNNEKTKNTTDVVHGHVVPDFTPRIHLGLDVFIDESVAKDVTLRMTLYRQASACASEEELADMQEQWEDRFGTLPQATKNFFKILRVKLWCLRARVEHLEAGKKGGNIRFFQQKPCDVDAMIQLLDRNKQNMKLQADMSVKIHAQWSDPAKRIEACIRLLKLMSPAS